MSARIPEQAHDLALLVRTCESLTDDRVVRATRAPRQLDQPVELLAEPQRERRRRLAALEAEQGVRHRPAFVHLADDVVGGVRASVKNTSQNSRSPLIVAMRTDLDAGLVESGRAGS